MTNCGPLGWVTDKERGYRYQPDHPVTGKPWPAMPEVLLDIWHAVSGLDKEPEACLVNFYADDARMGLHQDRDETGSGNAGRVDFARRQLPVSRRRHRAQATGRCRSSCRAAMSSCWAARGALPFTASTRSIPAPRRF